MSEKAGTPEVNQTYQPPLPLDGAEHAAREAKERSKLGGDYSHGVYPEAVLPMKRTMC